MAGLLAEELAKINRDWLGAKDDREIWNLQGQAKAIRSLLELPKRLGTDAIYGDQNIEDEESK